MCENQEYELNLEILEKVNDIKDDFILTKWIKNKKVDEFTLISYIIENKLLKYECKKCDVKNEWNGKPILLMLDRINNILNDNRISNLRFLCPNCYSQIRNKKKLFYKVNQQNKNYCIDCKKIIRKSKNVNESEKKCKSFRCKKCINKILNDNPSELL